MSNGRLIERDMRWTICSRAEFPTISEDDAPLIGLVAANLGALDYPLPWISSQASGSRQELKYTVDGYRDRFWTTACIVTPFVPRGSFLFPLREVFRHFNLAGANNKYLEFTEKCVQLHLRFPEDFG